MAEINGYLLTEEETKACADLVKKMRKRKTFDVNFSGCIRVKAKTSKEASDIFWKWVGDVLAMRSGVGMHPYFEQEGVEEDA